MAARAASLLLLGSLAACAGKPQPEAAPFRTLLPAVPDDSRAPPFIRAHYAPFARADAVAIALREWRLFRQPVDDDPPGTRPPPLPEDKPEREAGLWERVGEYWFLGLDAAARQVAWTGKHDENGVEFPAGQDASYAWSAAFISYVMRIAGAGDRFPYSPVHADYINVAKQVADGQASGRVISAQRPDVYAPVLGDLICLGRGRSRGLTFDDLPVGVFPGHCDIVVAVQPGQLSVIGGNVDDAVMMKHVPVNPAGLIKEPGGEVVDGRYPWFVVLKVSYDM